MLEVIMNYYIEILLKPNDASQEAQVQREVYTKLHHLFVSINNAQIGISFPDYNIKLGRRIRLHGENTNLQQVDQMDWLGEDMSKSCEVSKIRQIPSHVNYRTISRIRPNMSKSKMRRLKRRGSITDKEVENAYKAKMFSNGLTNPYLDLKSGSTKKIYRLFFNFGPLLDHPIEGRFDCYGLSNNATIPWF